MPGHQRIRMPHLGRRQIVTRPRDPRPHETRADRSLAEAESLSERGHRQRRLGSGDTHQARPARTHAGDLDVVSTASM